MKTTNPPKQAPVKQDTDFLHNINKWLDARSTMLFWIFLGGTVLLSLLLFDARMSFATDDATYIQNALTLIKHHQYPTFQAPLYPFMLAFLIKFTGYHLLFFKLCAVIFQALQVTLLYKAFQRRVPAIILVGVMAVAAFNTYILAYASSTFTEAFYMMIQALAIWVFFRLIDRVNRPDYRPQQAIGQWLVFGFVFLLLTLAKNVAMFAILAVIVYFLLRKEWPNSVLAVVSYAIFYLPYQFIMKAIFGDISNSQANLMLRKDFNDPSKGTVDFSDIIDRFITNFGNYISVHTYKMLGLRGGGQWSLFTIDKMKESQTPLEPSLFLSLIFIVLFGAGLYFAFRKNKYILFVLLLCTTLAGVTFAALHTFWNQDRLIVIFLPFLFMGMLYGIYGFAKMKNNGILKILVPAVVGLILVLQIGPTLKAASGHSKFISHYLKGDYFYGYPQVFTNYLKTAQWAGENLSDSNQVVCNKPAEAVAYGHRLIFTRLPKPLPQSPDSLLMALKAKQITHILFDAAGMGQVSNVAQFLYQVDPKLLTPVHQEGAENEQAMLLKINYEK